MVGWRQSDRAIAPTHRHLIKNKGPAQGANPVVAKSSSRVRDAVTRRSRAGRERRCGATGIGSSGLFNRDDGGGDTKRGEPRPEFPLSRSRRVGPGLLTAHSVAVTTLDVHSLTLNIYRSSDEARMYSPSPFPTRDAPGLWSTKLEATGRGVSENLVHHVVTRHSRNDYLCSITSCLTPTGGSSSAPATTIRMSRRVKSSRRVLGRMGPRPRAV